VFTFGALASLVLFIAAIYLLVKILRTVTLKKGPALVFSIASISLAIACIFTVEIIDIIRILLFDEQFYSVIHPTLIG